MSNGYSTMPARKHAGQTDWTPVAAYLRASSEKQETSCSDQLAEIKAYAAKNRFKITDVFKDDGVSGWKERERAGFNAMIDASPSGSFKKVLVWRQNRFSRFGVSKFFRYVDILNDSGVLLHTLDKGDVSSNSISDAIVAVVDQHGAESYVRSLAGDVRRGQTAAVDERGQWVSGKPPLGYSVVNKFLVLGSPTDIALVRRLFDYYPQGHSLRGIANRLNSDGIPAAKGGLWSGEAIKKILTNPAYVGTLAYGRRSSGRWLSEEQRQVVFKPDNHEAIIDREVFDTVQRKLSERSRPAYRTPITDGGRFLLSGLLFCGKCESVMRGWDHGDSIRYICNCNDRHGSSGCEGNAVDQHEVVTEVIGVIENYFAGDSVRDSLIEHLVTEITGSSESVDIEAIQSQVAVSQQTLQKQQRKLVLCDPENVPLIQDAIRAERARLAELQDIVEDAGEPKAVVQARISAGVDAALEAFGELRQTLLAADTVHLRELLRECVERLDVWADRHHEGKRVRYALARGCVTLRTNLSSTNRRVCRR